MKSFHRNGENFSPKRWKFFIETVKILKRWKKWWKYRWKQRWTFFDELFHRFFAALYRKHQWANGYINDINRKIIVLSISRTIDVSIAHCLRWFTVVRTKTVKTAVKIFIAFFADIFTVLKVHCFGENIHRFGENFHRFGENEENGENGYRQNLNSASIILFDSFLIF